MPDWKTSRYPNVRFHEHPIRRFKGKPDRYYSIRFRVPGKRMEKTLGWATEGWTCEKARDKLVELMKAHMLYKPKEKKPLNEYVWHELDENEIAGNGEKQETVEQELLELIRQFREFLNRHSNLGMLKTNADLPPSSITLKELATKYVEWAKVINPVGRMTILDSGSISCRFSGNIH